MNTAYVAARLRQIDWMMHRIIDAKAEGIQRSLCNPLTGRPLGERTVLFAVRQNSEYNDLVERLSDERKTLGGAA